MTTYKLLYNECQAKPGLKAKMNLLQVARWGAQEGLGHLQGQHAFVAGDPFILKAVRAIHGNTDAIGLVIQAEGSHAVADVDGRLAAASHAGTMKPGAAGTAGSSPRRKPWEHLIVT